MSRTTRCALVMSAALLSAPLVAFSADQPSNANTVLGRGFPDLERTPNGRLFVSWFSGGPKEPAPENTVYLCRSDDQGHSFTEPVPMARPTGSGLCLRSHAMERSRRQAVVHLQSRKEEDRRTQRLCPHLCRSRRRDARLERGVPRGL